MTGNAGHRTAGFRARGAAWPSSRVGRSAVDRAGSERPFGAAAAHRGGSSLTLAVLIVLVAVAVVGSWQTGWLASGARARSTADLVALAAARAQQRGRPACPVAGQTAQSNAAELVSCRVLTGWGEFVVVVVVDVPALPRIAGAPQRARAESRAGVVAQPAGGR